MRWTAFQEYRGDRLLIFESAVLVSALLVAFRCLGVRRASVIGERWARHFVRRTTRSETPGRAERIVEIVHGVARRIPGSRCLDRSLAAVLLLRREGFDARLVIGVRKPGLTSVDAHAWVELDGVALRETYSLETYAALDPGKVRLGFGKAAPSSEHS
ncbi:MAG: lasso peptide biosynthesis B2 protein [Thermoanaerobaculia bacterium]